MSSDANTITSLVRRMEQQGLVARPVHATDRRARQLRLRPAGLRRYRELRALAQKLQDEVLAAVPEPLRGPFLEHLETVANACQGSLRIPGDPGSP
jgi:DNA-binding MarR family transcriptional regulator